MTEMFLRDVLDIPESVHAGDFKIDLSAGFADADARIAEYVVTDQLRAAFAKALSVVRAAVRDGSSHAAYLHGSFGSGKSHFLTVLHAMLNDEPAARAKVGLQPVLAEHDEWLRGRRFLMVPYHLVGAADIDSAILGGYVATVRALRPGAPTPAVYQADAMLQDARGQRGFLADDTKFAAWLSSGAPSADGDLDDLDAIDDGPASWTSAELDRAFAAPAGDPMRDALVSALLSGPMSSYVRGASGDAEAFIPLENGLPLLTQHARSLGYDGLVLFLDELILWLQANMSDQKFVNGQVSKLVKLIESGDASRVLPIVSFISRQRDLTKLIGEDVTGADVKNLEAQVEYLAGRFDVVNLEDRNLPAIIRERVLKPKSVQARTALEEAFTGIESRSAADRDTLLDPAGATGADWADFRAVYPLSPALLNVLVALSGALQRERTGLKLLQEMLFRRRADMKLGQLIPLGDLWDVLSAGTGEAFTDRLRREAEAARRFYAKARAWLVAKYGGEDRAGFVADDRFVKTLLLAALAPEVSALARLTGERLAALNLGSIVSRTVPAGKIVVSRLRELQAEFGEVRSEGEENPVFWLHLSGLDVEPLLDAVGEQDSLGARRRWVKDQLWSAFGVVDRDDFVSQREIVWKGTRRTAEFVFGNVRDEHDLPDAHFTPSVDGHLRFVLDYPFDVLGQYPSSDAARVNRLRRDGVRVATIVWLPHFLSTQKSGQLGRLLKIQYLLERDRLDDYGAELSADDRVRVRHQLLAQRDNLTSQLAAALRALYGIEKADEATVGEEVGDEGHVLSLLPGHTPRPQAGAGFEQNLFALSDGLFDVLYPRHPNFDPTVSRKAITTADLRTVLGWITRAMEEGRQRVVVDSKQITLVRRIVHPLELGEVSDGPLNLSNEWRRRIEQCAAQHKVTGDYPAEDIRAWINEMGYTGLDRPVANLVIATYALLADRAWVLHGAALPDLPELDRIGPGYALRAQTLPSAEDFTAARRRAMTLFGVNVPDVLFARNINRLATEVRGKVAALESAVNGVRVSLREHAAALGLAEGEHNRPRTARQATELLAALSTEREPAGLVATLAGARSDATDEVLGRAIASAPAVLDALDRVDWSLLASARGLAGHQVVGERVTRLLDDLALTAADGEAHRSLPPVLGQVRQRALDLINDAARLASTMTPPRGTPVPPPTPVPPGAGAVGLTETGVPPVSGRPQSPPASGAVRTMRKDSPAEQVLSEMLAEIRGHLTGHPGAEVEITWRAIGEHGFGSP